MHGYKKQGKTTLPVMYRFFKLAPVLLKNAKKTDEKFHICTIYSIHIAV